MHQPSRSLTTTRKSRLLLFGFLYFVQGAMLAYVLVFNNLYLRHFGASAGQLSLLNGMLAVPFILKIGIGLLSDKVRVPHFRPFPLLGGGHRVPYMTLGLLFIAAGSVVAVFIHPVEQYPIFLTVALFIAFGLALYDTVTDGLAIDVTPKEQHKSVQGSMVIGRALGLVLLAAAYGRIIDSFNWSVIFWAVGAFALAPLPLLRHVHEPETRPPSQTFQWSALAKLWRPEIGRFTLYAIFYSVPLYGANAIITLFADEGLGGTLVNVGDVAAVAGLGMLVGGIAAVAASRTISIWRQGSWTAVAVTATLILISIAASLDNFIFFSFLWGICLSAADFVYVTISMDKSDTRIGAGHFAIFMAISNVGTGVGQAASTGLIDAVDFHWIFLGMGIINLMVIPMLRSMRADEKILPAPSSPHPVWAAEEASQPAVNEG